MSDIRLRHELQLKMLLMTRQNWEEHSKNKPMALLMSEFTGTLTIQVRGSGSIEQGRCAALDWLPRKDIQGAHSRAQWLRLVGLVEDGAAGYACEHSLYNVDVR